MLKFTSAKYKRLSMRVIAESFTLVILPLAFKSGTCAEYGSRSPDGNIGDYCIKKRPYSQALVWSVLGHFSKDHSGRAEALRVSHDHLLRLLVKFRPERNGAWTGLFIYVRNDAPDDFAYAVAKALDEYRELFHVQLEPWYYDPQTVAVSKVIPMHPGAIKYYHEREFVK